MSLLLYLSSLFLSLGQISSKLGTMWSPLEKEKLYIFLAQLRLSQLSHLSTTIWMDVPADLMMPQIWL